MTSIQRTKLLVCRVKDCAAPESREWHRFWRKVRAVTNGCWLWLGAQNPGGYGHLSRNGSTLYAHRTAYAWLRGAIPHGLTVDHLCRVRHCVNPWHMELVPIAVNTSRALRRLKTKAPCGHAYTMLEPSARWRAPRCRECRLAYFRERNRHVRSVKA